MLRSGSLLVRDCGFENVRYVSSKYIKPHPRSYKRRLFEAAVAPVLPPKIANCVSRLAQKEARKKEMEEYMPIELALVKKIRSWIEEEKFRVMAVCQLQPVSNRTLHFARNQFRMKGVEYGGYDGRIMCKVFENTPFQSLKPLFCSRGMCILYGYELESVKTIVDETAKLSYIVPLAYTVDSRILSMNEAKHLASLANVKDLRAQTVQILQSLPAQLTQTLAHNSQDLVSSLSRIG
ncbi:hypothetical protein M3Y96_01104000 [Aphelenchoides besseyi]|nr:hypothetical protein M3Y96_01104000 [Aphelenchoides besseyi]